MDGNKGHFFIFGQNWGQTVALINYYLIILDRQVKTPKKLIYYIFSNVSPAAFNYLLIKKFKPCIYMGLIEYLHRKLLDLDSQKVLFHHLMEICFLLYGSVGLRNAI